MGGLNSEIDLKTGVFMETQQKYMNSIDERGSLHGGIIYVVTLFL